MSKDITEFFGDDKIIPEAIEVPPKLSDLTKPGFAFGSAEEAVIDENNGSGKNDMFSDDIDGVLSDMENRMANGEIPDEIDVPDNLWVELDELGAETIVEVWEEMRLGGHKALYNWVIYSEPKKAKKIRRELALKSNRTAQETELLKKLFEYIDKHDEIRGGYMSAVPYNEKHKNLLIRVVDIQLKKLKMQGKKVPIWLLWAYLLIAPEVKMGIKMYGLKDDLPTFDFDINDLKK